MFAEAEELRRPLCCHYVQPGCPNTGNRTRGAVQHLRPLIAEIESSPDRKTRSIGISRLRKVYPVLNHMTGQGSVGVVPIETHFIGVAKYEREVPRVVGATASGSSWQIERGLLGHIEMKSGWHMIHKIEECRLINSSLVLRPTPHAKRHEKVGRHRVL